MHVHNKHELHVSISTGKAISRLTQDADASKTKPWLSVIVAGNVCLHISEGDGKILSRLYYLKCT